MKRTPFFLTVAAASILAAGATSWIVSSRFAPRSQNRAESYALGNTANHFTSYERDNYPDLTYAAENAVKAVVNIEKTEEQKARTQSRGGYNPFFDFFGLPQEESGGWQDQSPRERKSGGSGVIISPDGYIVTNNHVIENASKIKVTLENRKTYQAKLIGTDPASDIALIKIDAQDLPTLPFGDSDALRLGEWVLAIGSPYDLRSTVTAGIVSAKARNLDVIPGSYRVESFIQTDAAVNPGNSGGALINVKGELVGINTVIKSPTGSYAGYSFAVPVSIVSKVVADLKQYGVVQRAMLGIQFREVDDQFIEQMGEETGIKETGGVYVAAVEDDGAAKAAGIKKGDVITRIDNTDIDASATLLELVAKHRPGDKVDVTVKRDGQVKQFEVVLRNRTGKAELVSKDWVDATEALGGKFAEVSDKAKKELKIDGGIVVVGVNPGGILAKARVRQGYVITQINERSIRSISDLSKITEKITSIDGVYPDGRAASYSLVQ